MLSDDGRHDTVTKDEVYAEAGTERAYLDPRQRDGWWLRAGGADHRRPTATWQPRGWPRIALLRDELLAD